MSVGTKKTQWFISPFSVDPTRSLRFTPVANGTVTNARRGVNRLYKTGVIASKDVPLITDFQLWELAAEIRKALEVYAEASWMVEDLMPRKKKFSKEQTRAWLKRHAGDLSEAMTWAGWAYIEEYFED